MGKIKQTAFRDSQPNINIPRQGKPYIICPVCKNKLNVERMDCPYCGTLLRI